MKRAEDRGPKTEDRRRKNRFWYFFGFRFSDFGFRSGFTLVEVMVAVSVLTLGVLMLFPSFFMAADTSAMASDNLAAQAWATQKIWEEKDVLLRLQNIVTPEESGTFEANNRVFSWTKLTTLMEPGLAHLDLTLTWKQGGTARQAEYATFVTFGAA